MTTDIKAKELYDYDVPFVSFVPQGANMKKKFFLIKSDGGNQMNLDKEMLVELETIFKSDLPKDVESALAGIEKAKLSEKAKNAVRGALKLLNAFKGEFEGDMLKKLTEMAGMGFAAPKQEDPKPEGEKFPFKQKASVVTKAILNAAGEKKEDVRKAFNEYLLEEIAPESNDPRVVALMKENEDIRKSLETEKESRITKEFQEKASEYKNLNATSEELGAILKDVHAHGDEANVKKLEELLKAADKQISEGKILEEIGTTLSEKGSAWTKIDKAAEAIVKADGKVSIEQARVIALEKNPELYNEYEKERS